MQEIMQPYAGRGRGHYFSATLLAPIPASMPSLPPTSSRGANLSTLIKPTEKYFQTSESNFTVKRAEGWQMDACASCPAPGAEPRPASPCDFATGGANLPHLDTEPVPAHNARSRKRRIATRSKWGPDEIKKLITAVSWRISRNPKQHLLNIS